MNNFKSTALGLVKWIGLIALSLLINAAPMLFLRLGKNLPIYAEILLVALYLILVFLIFRSLWRRYQKHVKKRKNSNSLARTSVLLFYSFSLPERLLLSVFISISS